MSFFALARLIAVIATGLLAGIFLGYCMGASIALPRLPATSFVTFQQAIHRYYVRVMPPLQILATLGTLLWLYLLRAKVQNAPFMLVALVAAGVISVFAMTLAVNVPINKKLMTWDAHAPPKNVREIWAPWERVNRSRTIVSVSSFIIAVLAWNLGS